VVPNSENSWLSTVDPEFRVHLCVGPNCSARGSINLLPVLETAVERAGLTNQVEITASTCRNRCDIGPSLNVYPGPFFYREVTEEAIQQIVSEHLVGGKPVERWLVKFVLPNIPDLF
jgi:NADP-reducing hydrogenase subunit HndC